MQQREANKPTWSEAVQNITADDKLASSSNATTGGGSGDAKGESGKVEAPNAPSAGIIDSKMEEETASAADDHQEHLTVDIAAVTADKENRQPGSFANVHSSCMNDNSEKQEDEDIGNEEDEKDRDQEDENETVDAAEGPIWVLPPETENSNKKKKNNKRKKKNKPYV